MYSLRPVTAGSAVLQAGFKHYNARGDVIAQSNGAGAVTWAGGYEAGGKRLVEKGSTADRQKANTKEEDPSGLLNEGFRYRDMEIGMFISRDPAGFVDGPNVYTYVVQNPWSAFDPLGLSRKDADGFVWKASGHHRTPAAVVRDFGWHKDAKAVFDQQDKALPTPKGHGFTAHGHYNNEVKAEMAQFLVDKGADLTKMSAKDQAKLAEEFAEHMVSVNNEYIQGFNSVVHQGKHGVRKWFVNNGSKMVLKSTGMAAGRAGAKIINGLAKVTARAGGKVLKVLKIPMIGGIITGVAGAAQGNDQETIERDVFLSMTGGDIAKDALELAVEPMAKIYNSGMAKLQNAELDAGVDMNEDGITGPSLLDDKAAMSTLNDELEETEIEDE
jgi:RHS repeat-associated protein